MKIVELLNRQAENLLRKPAVIFQDKTITYIDLKENVFRLADALQRKGVGKGDKVGINLPNCPEYVYSYLACLSLGTVVVPLDFMLKSEELTSCLSHSETKLLMALPKSDVDLHAVKESVPSLETIISIAPLEQQDNPGSWCFYGEIVAQAEATEPQTDIQEFDLAMIMYTSGTTGRPKGILLTYKHLDGSPQAMHHFVDLSERDVKLCALPLSHIAGFIYIQNCLLFGITLIIMPRFNPYEFLKLIQQFKVTCFHLVPAMYTALLSLKQLDKFDLSSLRWVVVFGAPSSPKILERFHKHCPNAHLLNGWGMTETCPPNTVTPLGHANIKSVGKPSPHCDIQVVNDQDDELPVGEVGEIRIAGDYVMEGYYKDPDLTAQLKRGRWLYTGDLGRFDTEGFLYIVGRKKEMIKVGGQIVFAPEIETAFYKHDAVEEVAVIGISDKLRGEVVKAFVSLREGAQITAEELRFFAKDHLAHFKVPQSIEIRDTLPKNRTGKIDKEFLKNEAVS